MSIDLLNRLDGFSGVRNALRQIAEERGDWAGIPMPIDDARLVVEPTYPGAKELMAMGEKKDLPTEADDIKLRNKFYSRKRRCDIWVYEKEGRVKYAETVAFHHAGFDMMTMGASIAWGIEQEAAAQQTLAKLLPHHAFKKYLLTGMFLEGSKRSGVCYMFRRLKPTVALSMRSEDVHILCTLCLHPIAYYEGSWAGAMCPTDDVIAALMLMRGDEHMFWKRANHHPPHRPEAGL